MATTAATTTTTALILEAIHSNFNRARLRNRSRRRHSCRGGHMVCHPYILRLINATRHRNSNKIMRYWLLKAEPDSRIVKGKDVKFSVDDFESVGSTSWEGVRNYEARNLMKEMALGDKILFYHSNCKNPGIAGFAEVCKEAYPDYTAWDSTHPYFDEKSDKDRPRWFMVDAKFVSRARYFIPLSLLRHLAELPTATPPETLGYVGEDGINAIKAMPLITRGRLSVQRVSAQCWNVIEVMADQGGWDNMSFQKTTKARRPAEQARPTTSRQKTKLSKEQGDEVGDEEVPHQANMKVGRKRKASISENDGQPRRKSLRSKR
ncbi:PUA-like domain containing protein [Tylopilus felleus]